MQFPIRRRRHNVGPDFLELVRAEKCECTGGVGVGVPIKCVVGNVARFDGFVHGFVVVPFGMEKGEITEEEFLEIIFILRGFGPNGRAHMRSVLFLGIGAK